MRFKGEVMLLTVILSVLPIGFTWTLTFDFNDPKQLDEWEVVRDEGGKWTIEDGALKLTTPNRRWDIIAPKALKDLDFTDGIIQFKLKWLKGRWCEGGVVYRVKKEEAWQSFYSVHISAWDVTLRWGPVSNTVANPGGDWARVVRKPVKGWEKQPVDKWFVFKIEVKGKTHKVWAAPEGEKLELLIDEQDTTYDKGPVGLACYSGEAEEILLDDFSVEGPGIPSAAVRSVNKLPLTWGAIKSEIVKRIM